MGAADVQKEDTSELQLVDENDNEKAENTSDEIEELEEETTARESPIVRKYSLSAFLNGFP